MYALIENGQFVREVIPTRDYPNGVLPDNVVEVTLVQPESLHPFFEYELLEPIYNADLHRWEAHYRITELTAEAYNARAAAYMMKLSDRVQVHLDATAQAHGYDGILSLCSYQDSNVAKFRAEAAAGIAWRDAVWLYCAGVRDEVLSGLRSVPTEAELLAQLPVLNWPQ